MTPEEAAKILADVPTPHLLAELDRRAKAAAPPRVLFYGVWSGERAGHYLRERDGRHVWDAVKTGRPSGLYPWNTVSGYRQAQPEGLFWHWHHDGWTMLSAWDRSADGRGGCAATFVVCALVSPEASLALAREAFPKVFDRIEAHLGRPVALAGPAEVDP